MIGYPAVGTQSIKKCHTFLPITFCTMSSMRRDAENTRQRCFSARRLSSRPIKKTSLPDSSISSLSEMWLTSKSDGSCSTALSSESISTLRTTHQPVKEDSLRRTVWAGADLQFHRQTDRIKCLATHSTQNRSFQGRSSQTISL